jgi:uncharacterized protein
MRRVRRCLRLSALGFALLLVAGCVTRPWWFQGPYQPPTAPPEIPVIDLHVHVAGIGAGGSGCFVSPALRQSYKFNVYLKAFGVSREELETHGDALLVQRVAATLGQSRRVAKGVVLAMDGVIDDTGQLDRVRTEFYVPNRFVADAVARTTNLLFGASVNPYRPDALEQLDWAAAHGAVLVKWIPSVMQIDPADRRLIPFYERLKALGLPLLTHAGQERSFTHANDSLADPARLQLPLACGVTVIAAHVASTGENEGERDIDRLARLLRDYPHLYTEISSLTQINKLGYLREALQRPEFSGRLLYGTDFPLINTALVSPYYFPRQLTVEAMRTIAAETNPWDRDLALKGRLGVPTNIFTATARILRQRPGGAAAGSDLRPR